MPIERTCSRLVDEFRAQVSALKTPVPGELAECFMFCDLEWSSGDSELEDAFARAERDPAFTVEGRTRWVAFARICGEIRYYAGPQPQGARAWYWSGTDPERKAALDAERDYCEIAILTSVVDCVSLAIEYLSGVSLEQISVRRISPRYSKTMKASHDVLP